MRQICSAIAIIEARYGQGVVSPPRLEGTYVVFDHADGTFLPTPGAEWSTDIADARRMSGFDEILKTIENYDPIRPAG